MLLSAVCSGLMFFSMTWAGQNALWRIRVEVFRHVHRLSLGYYAENEAGDIMSRFTNDSETIQQVLCFALVQVLSSALLIVWIVVTICTFLIYVQRFNQPIQQVSVLWTNIQSGIAGGERIFGLLDQKPDLVNRPNAKEMPKISGKVEFVDVKAEYQEGQPVLKGINLKAEPGQTVAIVGPTGAGKTTIISLIPRFYDVT